MSLHEDQIQPIHDEDDTDWYEPEGETLPERPRRRLVTPVTLGLSALIVAAGGFFAGVQVQKGQGNSAGTAAAAGPGAGGGARAGGPPGGFAGQARGGAGQVSGSMTVGSVANKSGSVLYVTDSSGATVRVKASKTAKITRTAGASTKGVYPGDTVIVQGTKAKDGTLTATQIVATAKGASPGGFGGFGGGGRPGGTASAGG